MTTETWTLERSMLGMLANLGIDRAHFAGRVPKDWQSFLWAYPESVASLTLVCPRSADTPSLKALGPRLLIIRGDRGHDTEAVIRGLETLPEAASVVLNDYHPGNASDIMADRTGEVGDALLKFLNRVDQLQAVQSISLEQTDGRWDGLLYRVKGSGPPLVLLPLQYSPSQWDPILDRLSQHYCTITLSGNRIGPVASLESRALGGYLQVVSRVVDQLELEPGERVLDVGCGPGSLDRWLAHRTHKSNAIIGVDPSSFLLREAAAMARAEGLGEILQFQEAGGDSLPFPEDSFDVAMSFTAIQYVDADQMIREMMRVTRPGGRVGVLARGDDRPNLINLPVRAEIKSRIEGVRNVRHNPLGCNDASLYRRFHQAGLTGVKMFPQLAIFTPESDGPRLDDMQDRFVPILNGEELDQFRGAFGEATADGSFFVAEWFHCAVGTNRK